MQVRDGRSYSCSAPREPLEFQHSISCACALAEIRGGHQAPVCSGCPVGASEGVHGLRARAPAVEHWPKLDSSLVVPSAASAKDLPDDAAVATNSRGRSPLTLPHPLFDSRTVPITRRALPLLAALLIAASASRPAAAQGVDAPTLAITNVTVVDVTGGPSRAAQTVLIVGNRITAVAASGSTKVPRRASHRRHREVPDPGPLGHALARRWVWLDGAGP